jgi:uncharacterized phage protein gp47/JayE
MAKLTLKSEQQIVGSMAQKVLARTGLNDLNPGSILLTLLQAAASEDYAQYYQMLQIIRNYNIDTTTGTDLDNRAFEYGLTRKTPLAASGRISILREETFTKISSTFYTGFRSRIAGDTEIFVNNAEDFPSSGPQQTLIVGRGTPNEEEVTYTPSGSNPEDNTNYFKIVLDVPLTNDHSLEETVVLKQGTDTFIAAGTVIRVPASGRTPEITFSTTVNATILAGDDRVEDVNIICTQPGVIGNVGVNSITGTTAFSSPPFSGARASNGSAFSNGQDRETDTALRNRIKAHIQSLSQSTKAGIANAIDGLVDPDTAKRVVSSNIIIPDNVGFPVKIYLDDGTGFEPDFEERGQEVLIASAQGGEVRLQLDLFPLVKAQVETLSEEPFNMAVNGLTLQINVGNQSEILTFFQNQFAIPEAASSEEIVKAINNASTLVEARTSQVGKRIVLNSKADSNEDIQIAGGTANASNRLNFPTSKVQTFYLYKNDKLLSKDGETAFIDSGELEPFDFSGPDRILSVTVDGKTANVQSATIKESDFASIVAAASASAAQVAEIINTQIAGATASSVNGRLRLTSNTELSSASKIKVNSSAAATVMDFDLDEVVGKDQDYKLNPELGIIELVEPLEEDDLVTAGTRNTRAFLTAGSPANYSFLGGETLSIKVDGGSTQVITFIAGTNLSAATVAAYINDTLVGAKAVVRTIGVNTYLEIRTNTLDASLGSIEILSSSTANSIFDFEVDTIVLNIVPHTAYQVAANGGPYAFIEDHTLVIVLDNDFTGKTFVIPMDYDSDVTSGTSTTSFGASLLINVFLTDDDIKDFWVVFKDGVNTIEGDIEKLENPTPGIFRYFFKNPPPTNFEDFSVGDQASFSDMDNAANNGNFLISNIVVINTVHAAVLSRATANPSVLTPVLGDRYLVGADANTVVHADTVISRLLYNPDLPSPLTPSVNDRYIVAPGANSVNLANVKGQYADSNDGAVQEIHGYRYIVDGTGLNDWAGHNNEIAQYNGIGVPGWLFITPVDGDVVFDESDNLTYQFDGGSGTWIENKWGGKAGKVATWSGSAWTFTNPLDKEVRTVTSESKKYQYDVGANTWTLNDWGGNGNQIAEWDGSAWTFTVPAANDTVLVTDEAETYQYSGSAWAIFKFWVDVANAAGVTELATAAGSGLIGIRRQISAYNATTGAITLATAARATPVAGEAFIILPGTRENVVTFFNNTKVTSLSTKAYIELAQSGGKVQVSSKLDGSDGYVQVTGGKANDILQFSNSLNKGLRAYAYYIGLIKLVHSTIYGDEQDLVSFPGVGAAGVKFQILPPTVQEVAFSVRVRLSEGVTLSSVENDIKTRIISYVNGLGVAAEVIVSNVIDRILSVQGIRDVEITSPTTNIVTAENELARTKASIISVNIIE